MASAASTVATVPELCRYIAEQVRSREELGRLRLVSKTFDTAVVPVFFRAFRVWEWTATMSVVSPEHLQHVRSLEVWADSDLEAFQEELQEALPMMPRLQTLVLCETVLAAQTLQTMRASCPALTSLRLQFPDDIGECLLGYAGEEGEDDGDYEEARRLYSAPDLGIFAGLTALAIDQVYDPLPQWRAELAAALRASAGTLRRLHLSLCTETLDRHEDRGEFDSFVSFFDDLCRDYAATDAPPPLRLAALFCGPGVCPTEQGAAALARCIDLGSLRELYVANGAVVHQFDMVNDLSFSLAGGDSRAVPFRLFLSPDACPQLRRFGVEECNADLLALVRAVARDHPSFAAQLAVAFWNVSSTTQLFAVGPPDDDFTGWPTGGLRMLDIHLARMQRRPDEDGQPLPPPPEQMLADLATGDDNPLEGMTVYTTEDPASDHSFAHLDALAAVLPRLPRLTQLSLLPYTDGQQQRPSERAVEAAAAAARQLAAAGPRLRHVQVRDSYWRVWRQHGGIDLEPLSDLEIADVELWDRPVCGLRWKPGPGSVDSDEDEEEDSDQEDEDDEDYTV